MLSHETRLQERIEELEVEIAYWKSEAQEHADADVRRRIAAAFGLTPKEAWILAAFYARRGGTVTSVAIDEQSPGYKYPDERIGNSVQVMISRIRVKLGPGIVETVRNTAGLHDGGYRLGAAGIALLDSILLKE